ncbi:hypothetical protein M5X06_22410 [Paenibacillus alvei]|uniref:DUF5983 domain-containing protein n=1 Tax=Paenibacillus alvei TaxID=44250 RepID=A0ABT4H2F8_PAEAL|nr:hypothetical protein [Paenibacillus alvei]MCY9763166.1 hypothetical protein [Paenibacillus alvei]MCY9769543.1 hypothetical protein [Paenibacillus alvei]
MKSVKTVVLIQMFQDIVSEVLTFVGEDAETNAALEFEEWTGVPYDYYCSEREKGNNSYEILGEDYDGTAIYVRDAIRGEVLEKLEFNHVLSLSTAHLTEVACENLDNFFSISYPKGEYGCIVLVPEKLEEAIKQEILPHCLVNILKFIRNKDVDWIMFDRDAPIIPELPVYEW